MAERKKVKLLMAALFGRSVERLSTPQKAGLDRAIEDVVLNVDCGKECAADLSGVRVYKFKLANQPCLLTYRILDHFGVKLLAFRSYDN